MLASAQPPGRMLGTLARHTLVPRKDHFRTLATGYDLRAIYGIVLVVSLALAALTLTAALLAARHEEPRRRLAPLLMMAGLTSRGEVAVVD